MEVPIPTTPKPDEIPSPDNKADQQEPETTRTEEFAKTAAAAKISGTVNETTGFFKRKLGELTRDANLESSGHNQQLIGKIHRLVGTVRSIREEATTQFKVKRTESQANCRKQGGRLLDVVSDFVEDMKKTLFK